MKFIDRFIKKSSKDASEAPTGGKFFAFSSVASAPVAENTYTKKETDTTSEHDLVQPLSEESSFLSLLKKKADLAQIQDHMLSRNKAMLAQRCAYFEGIVISCKILSGNISSELRDTLDLLAASLHLSNDNKYIVINN